MSNKDAFNLCKLLLGDSLSHPTKQSKNLCDKLF